LNEIKDLEKDLIDITVNQREYAVRLDKLELKVEEMNKSLLEISISQQKNSDKFERLEEKIEKYNTTLQEHEKDLKELIEKMKCSLNHELNLKFAEHRQEHLRDIEELFDRLNAVRDSRSETDIAIQEKFTELRVKLEAMYEKVNELNNKKKELKLALLYPIIAALATVVVNFILMALQ